MERLHCLDVNRIIFGTSWKSPIRLHDFLFFHSVAFSLSALFPLLASVTVTVLYLHLSPAVCSGSGSGNRSVTCHYWSNSVIRHRALTVCSTLYAGAAGVLHTEGEIWFDTREKGADQGTVGAHTANVCGLICVSETVEKGNTKIWRHNLWFQLKIRNCGNMEATTAEKNIVVILKLEHIQYVWDALDQSI